MLAKTVGEFRKLIEHLPDEILIVPDFLNCPNSEEPGVVLHGFKIGQRGCGTVVSAIVDLEYLDDEDDEEDCTFVNDEEE